jgi:hypothetical protein
MLTQFDLRAQSTVVFDLTVRKDTLVLSNPTVVATGSSTNAVFDYTTPLLFYTTTQAGKREIRVFDGAQTKVIASGHVYSDLAVTPDGKGVSVLQQNNSGGHDLVKYPRQEGPGMVLVPSTGFTDYAWVDDNSLIALFPGKTNELRLYTIRPKKEMLIAQNTEEAIQRFFNTPSVTFIHKQSFTFSTVKRISAKDGKIDVVIDCEPEQSLFTWTPSEILISSDGTSFFSFNPKNDQDWKPIIVEGTQRLIGITSLSVNSAGDKLAMVVTSTNEIK